MFNWLMTKTKGFRNVFGLDNVLFSEIGNSAGDFNNFMVAAGGKMELVDGGGEEAMGGRSDFEGRDLPEREGTIVKIGGLITVVLSLES